MSDDKESNGGDGTNWLAWGLGGFAAVAAVVVLIYLSGFIFKWALIALAIYVLYRVGRSLLSGSSSDATEEPKLLTDESREPDELLDMEKDQELEAFKARLDAEERSE